jgi:phosphatidylserine/phosphatidylglycerophosphate/cardiolipin synthase-like enzyme
LNSTRHKPSLCNLRFALRTSIYSIRWATERGQFGSVILDTRSFRLNFEIRLAIYDSQFTNQLVDLQQTYIDRSELMDLETYRRRPLYHKILESFARLLGPLL